jgi:MFS family permease
MATRSASIRPRSGVRSGGWPLAAALAAVFLGAVDLTVIATVLPRMVFDLQINTADVDRYIWVVNAYLLAYIVSIPVMGRVSDLLGRPVAFQLALAVFLVGSCWSALAGDLRELIAARAVQGAGGGALLPVTMALVGDLIPAGRRLTALGAVGAVDTLGWVLGPIWGAAIVAVVPGAEPWRWAFWINLPVGIVVAAAIALASRRMPARPRTRPWLGGLDLPGALLLGAGLLLLNLGLSAGGELGFSQGSAMRALGGTRNPLSTYLVPLLVAGIAFLGAFALWERKTPNPILSRRLFAERSFVASMAANFLVGCALIVAVVDVPVVVALLVDQDRISTVSALMLAPFTLAIAILSFGGGFIARRIGGRETAALGIGLVFAGYVGMWLGLRGQEYVWMVPGLLVAGTGFGLMVAPIGACAIEASPPQDRGVAASFTILFRLLGMTMGISTLTAIGVRRLQALTNKVEPVVQRAGESTAEFLVRQSQYIEDVAIPLTLKVVRETFLIAAGIALVALIPVMLMRPERTDRIAEEERLDATEAGEPLGQVR